MLSNIAIAALAAIGTVSAGPLQRRQGTSAVESVTSAVESAVSSAVESVTSGASSAASGASSAASSATSTGAESSAASSTAASSAASSAATSGAEAGNQTYPAYPCPAGFLLTYASVNQTVPVAVTQVTQAAGQWADSPLFPNVTDAQGGNDVGATHTINVGGIALPEVLVSVETNSTSGSAIWNWNGSLSEPVSAMGVSLSNYSTVLQIYDPDYTTTGRISNTTLIKIFTNACATPQAEAVQLLTTLGGLELSNIAGALSGNSTSTSMMSSMPESMMSSTMMESSMASSTMMSSGASDSATSAASEATSGAASATSAAASGVESAISGATSAAASAASGVTSAA